MTFLRFLENTPIDNKMYVKYMGNWYEGRAVTFYNSSVTQVKNMLKAHVLHFKKLEGAEYIWLYTPEEL